jgi:putative peptidoglycan lipid II flippase
MLLLRTTMNARIGRTGLPAAYVGKLWAAAAAGAAVAWAIKLALPSFHPVVAAILVLGPYGVVFFGATWLLGIGEATMALARFVRRRG